MISNSAIENYDGFGCNSNIQFGENFGKMLKSIVDQTYKNIEIIVVDKFSEDKTVEIAKSYGARMIQDYGRERGRRTSD